MHSRRRWRRRRPRMVAAGGSWRAARMHRAAAACTLAKGDAPISLPLLLSLHRSDANHWKMHPADLRPAWLSPGSSRISGGGRRQSCSTKYALCSYAVVVVVVKALSCKTKKTNLPQGCRWFLRTVQCTVEIKIFFRV